MPKTNAEYCRNYRRKKRENKIKKTAKSSTERVREFRARRKASLTVENESSITHNDDFTVQNSESDHSMDTQQCIQATQPLVVANVAVDNLNQINAVYYKEEPEDNDMDIGPTVLQHADSHYRTGQVQTNIKQEIEIHNEDNEGCLCIENDQVLFGQVKAEFIADSQKEMNSRQCSQTVQPPVVTNVPADYLNQVNAVYIKEEDNDIDIGPTVLQHMDSHYRTSQTNIKQEDEIHNKDDKIELCKIDIDRVLCSQVKLEFTEDRQKESNHSQFRCDKCLKIFQSKVALLAHQKQVHATNWHRCEVCNKEFKGKKYLENHIRNIHSGQNYECDVCKKIYKSNQMLRKHILRLHRNNLTGSSLDYYKCDKCSKKYLHKQLLMQHYDRVHGKGTRTCNECNKEFKCKAYLLYHRRYAHNRKQFECDICKKTYKTKRLLREHILSLHLRKPEDSHLGNYKCDKCSRMYLNKSTLMQHYNQVHGTDSHKCDECNKEFKCEAYLLSHKRNVHGRLQLECEICKKIFNSTDKLRMHMSRCHACKPEVAGQSFTCDYCQKIFPKKDSLQRHIKSVHGKLVHQCLKCYKCFKCRTYLQQHEMLIHGNAQKCAQVKCVGKFLLLIG